MFVLIVPLALPAASSVLAQSAEPAGRLEITRKPGQPGHARAEFAFEWRPGVLLATALQFDIECSPGWRAVVGAGQAATLTGKTVATSTWQVGESVWWSSASTRWTSRMMNLQA